MIQSKKILSAILLIGTFVACSNEDDTFLQEGGQQGARYTATVTAGIDNDGTRVALGESVNGVTKVLWSVGDAIALVDKANNNFVFERVQADGEDDEVTNATFTYDNSENPLPSIADIAYFGYPAILPSSWANQPGTADGLSQYMQLEAILPEGAESYDNLNLHFTHKTAVMKITLTHSDFIGQDVSLSINATGLLPDGGNRIMTDVVAVDENGTVTAYVVVPITGTEVVDLAVSAFINGESAYYTMIGTKTLVAGKLYKVTRNEASLVEYPASTYLPEGRTFMQTVYKSYTPYVPVDRIKFVANSTATSGKLLFTDENGIKVYGIINGEWLEFHTVAKEFVANKNCYKMFGYEVISISMWPFMNVVEIDLGDKFNTENVEDMSCMFQECQSLKLLNLGAFTTDKVTNMGYMFSGCNLLTAVDVGHFKTDNVTDMSEMFRGCGELQTLDLLNFNTENVVSMANMFSNCNKITSLDLSSFVADKLENTEGMFSFCRGLTNIKFGDFRTEKVTTMESMFSSCYSLLSVDLSSFDVSNVKNMGTMFYNCSSLKSIDLSGFNTSSVTYMGGMFSECKNLTSIKLDPDNFDTKNVLYMGGMFSHCSSLESIDLSGFNTNKVTSMYQMFNGCTSLQSVDLSSFNTENVTTMEQMFVGCSSLESIDLSGFNTNRVTDMDIMFASCSSLTSLDLSSFSFSENCQVYNMLRGVGLNSVSLPVPIKVSEDGYTYLTVTTTNCGVNSSYAQFVKSDGTSWE